MELTDMTSLVLDQMRATLGVRLPPDMGVPFSVIARDRLKIRTVDNQIVPFKK